MVRKVEQTSLFVKKEDIIVSASRGGSLCAHTDSCSISLKVTFSVLGEVSGEGGEQVLPCLT